MLFFFCGRLSEFKVTKVIHLLIPLILDDLLAFSTDAKYFKALNLKSGFWQICMA